MLSLQTHTACWTERASTRSTLLEALINSNPSGLLPTSGPWINYRRGNAVGRCTAANVVRFPIWDKDTSRNRGGHGTPTGRREWTERKWTRKDDVRGRDVSCEKGLRTNEDRDTKQEWQGRAAQNQSPRQKPVWKLIYLTGLPPRLQWTRDSMRRAMDCNSPGQRGEGRGQWWSTYRLGMVGDVKALPKYDVHWAGGGVLSQKADFNISHEYLPGSNLSRFKFILQKKEERNYLNLVILLFVLIIFRTDATVAAVLFKLWHFHF